MTTETFLSLVNVSTMTFLGIYLEAVPFLLLGAFASGIVEVFISREDIENNFPRSSLLAGIVGATLGLALPVGEGGAAVFTRRLLGKGLPPSAGVSFLLGAPIVNLATVASTIAVYGLGQMLIARVALGAGIAVAVGLIFTLSGGAAEILRRRELPSVMARNLSDSQTFGARWRVALSIAGDDFFSMGPWLAGGALAATVIQALLPREALMSIGSHPVQSVMAMIGLAGVMSTGSTTDAIVAQGYAGTFTTGSILAFLVFGPMADIKNVMMFSGVFRLKHVAYLFIFPLLLTMLAAIFINLNLSW